MDSDVLIMLCMCSLRFVDHHPTLRLSPSRKKSGNFVSSSVYWSIEILVAQVLNWMQLLNGLECFSNEPIGFLRGLSDVLIERFFSTARAVGGDVNFTIRVWCLSPHPMTQFQIRTSS